MSFLGKLLHLREHQRPPTTRDEKIQAASQDLAKSMLASVVKIQPANARHGFTSMRDVFLFDKKVDSDGGDYPPDTQAKYGLDDAGQRAAEDAAGAKVVSELAKRGFTNVKCLFEDATPPAPPGMGGGWGGQTKPPPAPEPKSTRIAIVSLAWPGEPKIPSAKPKGATAASANLVADARRAASSLFPDAAGTTNDPSVGGWGLPERPGKPVRRMMRQIAQDAEVPVSDVSVYSYTGKGLYVLVDAVRHDKGQAVLSYDQWLRVFDDKGAFVTSGHACRDADGKVTLTWDP